RSGGSIWGTPCGKRPLAGIPLLAETGTVYGRECLSVQYRGPGGSAGPGRRGFLHGRVSYGTSGEPAARTAEGRRDPAAGISPVVSGRRAYEPSGDQSGERFHTGLFRRRK